MEVTYHEAVRQPYANSVFSSGSVEGHPVDTMYLRAERDTDGEDGPLMWLLRPDEAAAIIYCLSGALWSALMQGVGDQDFGSEIGGPGWEKRRG